MVGLLCAIRDRGTAARVVHDLALGLSLLAGAATVALAQRAAGLRVGCGRPFGDRAVVRSVDFLCPNEGGRVKGWSESVWAAAQLENQVKSEFCAPGPARELALADFVDLQRRAEELRAAGTITYGDEQHLPADRASLRALGEGTRVRFRGYILGAHDAMPNLLRGGESCNCNRRGKKWNDIHMTLVDSPAADGCDGIVAEMSPHFRPYMWTDDLLQAAAGKPVIVEGQLFFDSDHEPCGKAILAHPKRASLWEIHPVYDVQVCRSGTLEQCPIDDPAAWMPLEQLLLGPPPVPAARRSR